MTRLSPVGEITVAEHAANEIRAAIQDGRYPPGTRLVERKLATQLGISHIPVREALARLTDEGLVERLPRRGARVADLGLAELDEISSLRTVLEEFVVLRVQERVTAGEEAELQGIVDRMQRAAAEHDVEGVFELDRQFHAYLWELTDHSALVAVVRQLLGRLEAFLRAATLGRSPSEMPAHARAHQELLDAILSRDPERARSAMAAHIEDATERLHKAHSSA